MTTRGNPLVFSGELWGSLDPCGCSGGTAGGFTRRAASLAEHPGCAPCELGDLAAAEGPLDDLKFDAVVDLLNALQYRVICPGEAECVGDRLQRLSRQFQGTLVCANLHAPGLPVRAYHTWQAEKQRIVLIGALSPGLVRRSSAEVRVIEWREPLRRVARQLKPSDQVALAFHGPLDEAIDAARCVSRATLIVCTHEGQTPMLLRRDRSQLFVAAGSDGAGLAYADLLSSPPVVTIDRLLRESRASVGFVHRLDQWKTRLSLLRRRLQTVP